MAKRGFDVLVSAVVMAVASPLWLVVALLIKVESAGPVLHRKASPDLRAVVEVFRRQATTRQAFVASVIFGSPKALEMD